MTPAQVHCTLAAACECARPGHAVWFDVGLVILADSDEPPHRREPCVCTRVLLGRCVTIDQSLDQFYDWNRRVSASRLAA